MSDTKIDQNLANTFKKYENDHGSIFDFIESFISDFSAQSTRRAYKNDLVSFVEFLKTGSVELKHPKDIRDYHYKTYRDAMGKDAKSSATINRRLVAIRAFLKWALYKRYIDINPVESIKLPKIQTENPTQAFKDEEVLQMIDAPDVETFKGNVQRMSFALLFHLGVRRAELLTIKIRDFRQDRRNTILSVRGKGSKTRELPITLWLSKELAEYQDRLKSYGMILGPDDFLLQVVQGEKSVKPVDGSTVYRWIKQYTLKLGIYRRLSPHSCRATAISHLLDTRQVPIRDVAIFAGHENVNTTERYDKRRDNLDKNAAYEVDYEDRHKKVSK